MTSATSGLMKSQLVGRQPGPKKKKKSLFIRVRRLKGPQLRSVSALARMQNDMFEALSRALCTRPRKQQKDENALVLCMYSMYNMYQGRGKARRSGAKEKYEEKKILLLRRMPWNPMLISNGNQGGGLSSMAHVEKRLGQNFGCGAWKVSSLIGSDPGNRRCHCNLK